MLKFQLGLTPHWTAPQGYLIHARPIYAHTFTQDAGRIRSRTEIFTISPCKQTELCKFWYGSEFVFRVVADFQSSVFFSM